MGMLVYHGGGVKMCGRSGSREIIKFWRGSKDLGRIFLGVAGCKTFIHKFFEINFLEKVHRVVSFHI